MFEMAFAVAGCSYIAARMFMPDSDRYKIKKAFRNLNYRVKDHDPSLIRTIKKDDYQEYVYNVPYGLIDDSKLQQVLQKTLDRSVHVYFDGKLHVRVYKSSIPKRIAYNWQQSDGWTLPIGIGLSGMVMHDFDKVPHMTVAGATRQGKTVLLKLILAHLISNHPDDAEIYIVDMKGGLEFGPYERMKQIKRVASSVDEAGELFEHILAEMRQRMKMFREKEYTNILDTDLKRRTFIIVDEGAELTPSAFHSKDEKKVYQYCQQALSEITRIAGAMGYRNIFCTQYPTADTLPRQVKQNSDAKISFRLPTEVASRVAIDESGAEQISNVGRAIYRTHERQEIQVPYVSDEEIKEKLGRYMEDVTGREEKIARRKDIVHFG
ncbi:FtsK/SpoIIIE domain-containing protein [Terribacillus saccharophilus]|uniref:FtsK/SpoIIIE domain-containing protein n=1 Tax=Terribacillus saccharophilus TaxID=361277 RepID=UPI0039820046